MDRSDGADYVPAMSQIRPRWRLLLLSILLLGGAAIGVGMALPGSRDSQPPVKPYDPMPRW